jgi:hypothetical protein
VHLYGLEAYIAAKSQAEKGSGGSDRCADLCSNKACECMLHIVTTLERATSPKYWPTPCLVRTSGFNYRMTCGTVMAWSLSQPLSTTCLRALLAGVCTCVGIRCALV